MKNEKFRYTNLKIDKIFNLMIYKTGSLSTTLKDIRTFRSSYFVMFFKF